MPKHSVLIVGAGISGMRAALAASERGSDVALISKVHPLRTAGGTSQGGINAAVRDGDTVELHATDTVKGGDYLADQNAVELLTAGAPRAVITLDHWGVPFNRDGGGRLDARSLCGASRPRACFVDDMTGHAVLQVLHEQILKAGVRTYDEWVVTRLLLDDGACVGVVALELASGKVEAFGANAVVLATGGCARVYEPTGAAYGVTGDGVALAYRAGAPLMDMEMVQFHPLGIKGSGMILTDTLLGLGGYLVNRSGERFTSKHAPTAGERAPRDIVAKAAEEEIASGRAEFVALDLRHLNGDDLKRRLPFTSNIIKTQAGVDPVKETIPVRPVAHRAMGGLQVSLDGATGVAGLFAAGGCAATGVHGANGLGGNWLLEALVFGERAGLAAAQQGSRSAKGIEAQLEDERNRIAKLVDHPRNSERAGAIRSELGGLMRRDVGPLREASGLTQAASTIKELSARSRRFGIANKGSRYNYELVALLELESLLTVGEVIATAAGFREESRGAHYRQDRPGRDDAKWLAHTVASFRLDGPAMTSKPVATTKWKPEGRRY
jgi:succinate dehydrogenase / fumarate reductase flavoprotein subunit